MKKNELQNMWINNFNENSKQEYNHYHGLLRQSIIYDKWILNSRQEDCQLMKKIKLFDPIIDENEIKQVVKTI